jgi:branched-chain amino acid transport system ATP-binding protein
MLSVSGLDLYYGDAQALAGVSLDIREKEIVAIIGANGAGKTSLIRTIAGIERSRSGKVIFKGREITNQPSHRVCDLGIGQVAEGRQVFPTLSVLENLEVGGLLPRARRNAKRALEEIFGMFPRLAERRAQLAGSMSGGEQQMLALGRALMTAPRILLVDEPSVGLAPVLVARTIDKIKELKERYQLTVLMAEQNFPQALRIADRGYVIVHGKIAFEGKSADELNNNDLIRKFYLGL